mmetsp:Transcript_419/g.855  ORF Transcript_419/g.855 Transcript_419/m.855 type:complete len:83 (+) Transcript_419:197-445(+)
MNESQVAFIVLYLIYIAVTVLFHNTCFAYPFRLLTTFLHEISHALACWLSCGSVRTIKINIFACCCIQTAATISDMWAAAEF